MGRMVVVAAAVLVLCGAGCKEDEHFPPGEGGGPGGGGGSRRDAGDDVDAGEADAGDQLRGRLCDVADVRNPVGLNCSGPEGIDVVELDSDKRDETNANGDFALDVEFDSSLILAIGRDDDETRDAIVRVDMWGGQDPRVPRVDQDAWDDLLFAIGAGDENDGSASIALYIEGKDGLPLPDVTVIAPGESLVFYDDQENPDEWTADVVTGAFGAALIVDVPAEENEVTILVDDEDFVIPVRPDHLTWARVP